LEKLHGADIQLFACRFKEKNISVYLKIFRNLHEPVFTKIANIIPSHISEVL
jgi:hypothetical protein